MTRDEILALKPGPELDRLVAEKVMGIVPREVRIVGSTNTVTVYNAAFLEDGMWSEQQLRTYGAARPYSTDPAAAWNVIRKVQIDFWVEILCARENGEGKETFGIKVGEYGIVYRDATRVLGDEGQDFPELICKATLLAAIPDRGWG